MAESSSEKTPMMRQYDEIKAKYPNAILLFRLGDFYEMFNEDAILASDILGIVLTKRGNSEGKDIPMCGIPFHSYESYVNRLLKANLRVAMCEQLETPEEAKRKGGYKAVVKRDVVRVLTPGTILDDNLLEQTENNFLVSLCIKNHMVGVAWADISTGDFLIKELNIKDINSLLYSISSKEILVPSYFDKNLISIDFHKYLNFIPEEKFNLLSNRKILEDCFKETSFVVGDLSPLQQVVCGVLVDYIDLTQKTSNHIIPPRQDNDKSILRLDFFTQRSLEIHQSYSNIKEGSLKYAIDRTNTSIGSRYLAFLLNNPSNDINTINNRLEVVEFFMKQQSCLDKVISFLSKIPDVERALSRVCLNRGSVLDLALIRTFIQLQTDLIAFLVSNDIPYGLQSIIQNCDLYYTLRNSLEEALVENISIEQKDGGFVKPSYNRELDFKFNKKQELIREISNLQNEYKFNTGASSLKIQYTTVAGYFIEVSNKQAQVLTADKARFHHKQTLSNNTRFTTASLIQIETEIDKLTEEITAFEQKILKDLINEVVLNKNKIYNTAKNIAFLDVLVSFTTLSLECGMVKPKMVEDSSVLDILKGKHLVVENSLKKQNQYFVPNDCNMKNEKDHNNGFFLITGPNMSGKSTYLRQNAIIVLLAHMGCFVPAQEATIGICDAIFSRVGASDDLFKGQSTFMVEMLELSAILSNATSRSFIILDEIGRGTSTYDGLSLAWATIEYIHNNFKSRTIFATHYHELTRLEEKLDSLECYYVDAVEYKNDIVFMHKVKKGTAKKSYGIEVAKLAGVPSNIINRAKEILSQMEQSKTTINLNIQTTPAEETLPLFASNGILDNELTILKEIKATNIDDLSPRQALDLLYSLKNKLTK